MISLIAEWVVLPDGQEVCIRPYQTEDGQAVRALLERLSPRSLAQRFHSAGVHITEATLDLVTAGHALAAEVEGDIVAVASCRPAADHLRADAALVVDDVNQRRGIGTAMCHRLNRDVRGLGIRSVRAGVGGDNHGMLKLLRSLALPMTRVWDQGVLSVEIQLRHDPVCARAQSATISTMLRSGHPHRGIAMPSQEQRGNAA